MRFGIIRDFDVVTNQSGNDEQSSRMKLVVAKLCCHWLREISCIMESMMYFGVLR